MVGVDIGSLVKSLANLLRRLRGIGFAETCEAARNRAGNPTDAFSLESNPRDGVRGYPHPISMDSPAGDEGRVMLSAPRLFGLVWCQ